MISGWIHPNCLSSINAFPGYSARAWVTTKTGKMCEFLVIHQSYTEGIFKGIFKGSFKGWVRANALGLLMASICIEDTTTSTCWGSKCLWSQLFLFLLNLWAPPLVAIGTCETQGRHETMTLLRGLLCGCQGQALGGSHTKTSHSRQSGHAWLPKWLCPVAAKRANKQGGNVHISNATTLIVLILVSGDSWGIALTLWG